MSYRFRESIKLFKGVRLNLSKTGVSLSIGSAPYTMTIGKRGLKHTVSIPNTGLSFAHTDQYSKIDNPKKSSFLLSIISLVFKGIIIAIILFVAYFVIYLFFLNDKQKSISVDEPRNTVGSSQQRNTPAINSNHNHPNKEHIQILEKPSQINPDFNQIVKPKKKKSNNPSIRKSIERDSSEPAPIYE